MKKLMITAACAVAASVLSAQEMGATATEAAAGAPDQGAEVAAQADAQAAQLTAIAPSDEFVSAEDLVAANLEKMGIKTGYDPTKKAIVQIGAVEIKVSDPANASDPDFITIREAKANDAYMQAKAKIIRTINTDFHAVEKATTVAEYGEDDIQKAFTEKRVALEAKRDELAKKLEQLDKAEAAALRGVTMTDRFGAVVEGIAKKLDEKFNTAAILAQKKAVRDQLKTECDALLADYKVLEAEAKKIPPVPDSALDSSVQMLSKMPLLGSSVLTQAESWDKTDGTYQMAVAVVWSPKLQEYAVLCSEGVIKQSPKKGQFTPQEWIKHQDLAVMVGPRRFTDNLGNNIFVGIAAVDMTGKTKQRKAKKMMAETEAIKNVAFSLGCDMEAYREMKKSFREYDDDLNTSKKSLNDVIKHSCDANIQGCSELAHKEFVHPISGRKTYVVAYYIDPGASSAAGDFLKKAYAGAVRQTKATQYRRGQHAGMEKVLDNQRKSTAEYNKGVADGAQKVTSEVQRQENSAKKPVSAGASGSKRQPTNGQSQGGAYSGDATIDTDF